ncbi:syntabulin-like isoform X2 [Brienomyrus brachyistius]|nr:syntabulin-like isoform X2 [Brienomyrus brachyistius]
MGPFPEHEEYRAQGKERPRSRIPRLILRPQSPDQAESPLTESPFSEEDNRDCDLISDHSKGTVSTSSFCSDDTGCPSSQLASPSKTPTGSESSPLGSPSPNERKGKVRRARTHAMAEWNVPPIRPKREQRPSAGPRGSEADFSSSSSAGSLGASRTLATSSGGKKICYPRSRGSQTKGGVLLNKTLLSTSMAQDKELVSALYRTSPRAPPSNSSSSNSSPTTRRSSSGRLSCVESYGIKAPNPEQYLTPLQQKEVAIRHLKTKLKDSESRAQERESEIEELKAQLERMREDWIEEECHRVEAQLALKEARKEIGQLRQVVETMRSSLTEKDKGIQKYFTDINIQNRKLESLLHSMEMAQSGSLHDESALDFICDSPTGSMAKLEGGLALEDQAIEEMADSGLLVNDEMANQTDIFEQVLTSTAVDPGSDAHSRLGAETLVLLHCEQKTHTSLPPDIGWDSPSEKAVQTDITGAWDLQDFLCHLLKLHAEGTLPVSVLKAVDISPLLHLATSGHASPILLTPEKSSDSGLYSELADLTRFEEPHANLAQVVPKDTGILEVTSDLISNTGLSLYDHGSHPPCSPANERQSAVVAQRSYWSSSFLVDLVALAVPALPTVAWLYAMHKRKGVPVYNIGMLIRGCCLVGLHSLRQASLGPNA